MLMNMLVRELALLATFYGGTAENIDQVIEDRNDSSCQTLVGPSGKEFTDFDKLKFTTKTSDGRAQLSVAADRCGGDDSIGPVTVESGNETFRFSMPEKENCSQRWRIWETVNQATACRKKTGKRMRMMSSGRKYTLRLFLLVVLFVSRAQCFPASSRLLLAVFSQQSALPRGVFLLAASNEDEDLPLRPETSFGADVVPESQRPVNEFLDVTSQPLFGWASLESGNRGLVARLAIVYSVLFAVVCYPIAGATFTQEGYELQKVAAANVGALLVVFFILVRIYSGWSYIGSRLTSRVIEYEESGWYDGDFEPKSPSEQLRDELLYEDKVKPVVERVKMFTLGAGALWLASCVAYNAALSAKPVFDEYDPAILERLRYDEKLADVAAEQSQGRPTYCDNRYYRAVANGGQGCN